LLPLAPPVRTRHPRARSTSITRVACRQLLVRTLNQDLRRGR
jgi:hypothetical protein